MNARRNDELLYPLDARPPLFETLLIGLQHVLAMFAGVVTPALIVGGQLGFGVEEMSFFVGMALFASGLSTYVQVRTFGPVGSGLLSVQGTSFTFVKAAVQAGQAGGLPLILGMSIAAAPAEMIISRVYGRVRRLFPPIVTATAVTLIGLSLVKVGMTDAAGGFGAADFGSVRNMGLSFFVLVMVIVLNRFGPGFLRAGSIMLAIVAGYCVAACMGLIQFRAVADAAWATWPRPLKYGLSFDVSYLLPWMLAYLVTSIETVGDLTATSLVSNQPITGEIYRRRIAGGTLADAIGSIIAALFNSLPNTTFSQNNGVIQITGVAARRVGYAVSVILVVLGLSPKIGALVALMPKPVLGGATLALFGMVAAAGIRIASMTPLGSREMLILAIGLGTGLGVESVPEAMAKLPEFIRVALANGLVTGTLFALVLNAFYPERDDATP